jgi:glutathione S-transferase
MTERLRVLGIHGSPYSRKLLAALRYRRLPYAWIVTDSPEARGLPRPAVGLLPQLFVTNEDGAVVAVTDSTPILRDLDRRHADRRVRPPDPVLALIDALLEDWADEWLTKPMFHYRWTYDDDIRKASQILPRWSQTMRTDDEVQFGGGMFAERQIGRLGVVGSNATTAPVIEESYRRTLRLLNEHLASTRFLLGARPSTCDFAVYGQLTQLTGFDPTPSSIALELAPRVVAWVHFVEDLSGLEPGAADAEWIGRGDVADTLRGLLAEIGRTHVPFLLANAAAIDRGDNKVDCTIDGREWTQQTFPYQRKCVRWLREEHAALTAADRRDADTILAGSGCEALFG